MPSSMSDASDFETKERHTAELKPAVSRLAGVPEFEQLPGLGAVDVVYEAKVKILNQEIARLGMGRYQIHLWFLCGFGWFLDNGWIKAVLIAIPQIGKEFHVVHASFIQLALTVGFVVGALGWGVTADVIGRRWAFNLTLLIASVFGLVAGAAPNFIAVASLLACFGVGSGGSLPIDGALFIEFVPGASQSLLVLMTSFWSFAQLFASLLAWAFVGKHSCATASTCTRANNMGWRYLFFTMGAVTFVMWCARFFLFHLYKSLKYLLAKGRDKDAIDVIKAVATYNGKTSTLTVQDLADGSAGGNEHTPAPVAYTNLQLVRKSISEMNMSKIRSLFASRKMALQTTLTIAIWFLIGLAYPLYNAFLPFYLASHGATGSSSVYLVYRNYAIISVCPLPGSIIAYFASKQSRIGMQKFMAFATMLTGLFLCLTTTARSPNAVLGWSCASNLTQNTMYGILYSYTPLVFPGPIRAQNDDSPEDPIASLVAAGMRLPSPAFLVQ